MKMPQISVIVPVYNVERYLQKCVRSVIDQTYKDFELILVDDGSTDKSPQICDEWADKDERIKVIHKENGGLSDARNTGLDNIKGSYIFFLDSDDYIMPDTLNNLRQAAGNNKKVIAVVDTLLVWDNRVKKDRSLVHGRFSGKEALTMLLKGEIPNYAPGKLYSSDLWEDMRFPLGKTFEDIRTVYKVFWKCRCVYINDYIGYCYLQRQNSITDQAIHTRLDAVEAYKEQLEFAKKHCKEAVPVLDFRVQETTARYIVLKNHIKNKKIGNQLNEYRKWVLKNLDSVILGKLDPSNKKRCMVQALVLISPSMYGRLYMSYVNNKKKGKGR